MCLIDDSNMSVSRLFKGMGSIWVGEAPRACLPQQAQENLEHIERSLGGATDSTKTTVCVGAGSLRNRVSMANQGMIRKFKTNSTCPQPVFLVLRHVGYINSRDDMSECWMHPLTARHPSRPSLYIGHSLGGALSLHDLLSTTGWRRDGASNRAQETPGACIGCKPTSASRWTHHLGERIGNVRPSGGITNTKRAEHEVQALI